MKKPRKFDRMMDNLELAMELAPDQAGKIIAEAAQALHRVNRIAQAGKEWERFDILPTAGPRTGFMGRVIWEDEHRTPNGRSKRRELIETQGGALVAVDTSYALDDRERDLVKVHVAKPQEDQAAQRAEIMEFWDWDDGALALTKKLGWNTAVWID